MKRFLSSIFTPFFWLLLYTAAVLFFLGCVSTRECTRRNLTMYEIGKSVGYFHAHRECEIDRAERDWMPR